MSAFTLDPKPTFKMTVQVPIPGEGFAPLELTCKYRNKTERKEFADSVFSAEDGDVNVKMDDVQILKEIIVGWNIADKCTPENIEKLAENYPTVPSIVYIDYMSELGKVREKN